MKMKNKTTKIMEQPKPFTPGVTRGMVREYAYRLYRDKLPEHPLTLKDWVPGEFDGSRGRRRGGLNRPATVA